MVEVVEAVSVEVLVSIGVVVAVVSACGELVEAVVVASPVGLWPREVVISVVVEVVEVDELVETAGVEVAIEPATQMPGVVTCTPFVTFKQYGSPVTES